MKGIGIIGCGNMGSIIVDSIVSSHIYPAESIYVSDIRKSKTKYLKKKYGVVPLDNISLAENSKIIILAVKPANVKSVVEEIKDIVGPKTILISIAAGITTAKIEKLIGEKDIPVIRVMPNINIKVKKGIISYCPGRYAKGSHGIVEKLFSPLGVVFKLSEKQFDLITAISGSGPGFIFYIAECFKKIVKEKGLPERYAHIIIKYLFYGSSKMLFETDEKPERLKEMVCSPGGTTLAGIEVFEKAGFFEILKDVIDSAEKRGKELQEQI